MREARGGGTIGTILGQWDGLGGLELGAWILTSDSGF
jgi:hypothetical protein